MTFTERGGLAVLTALALAVCGCSDRDLEQRPQWVIRSRLVFLSQDLGVPGRALAPDRFRLMFPYVSGDLYGPPTTGDFLHPVIAADGRFAIDLNRTHRVLLASLEPTDFSLSYLRIDPTTARIARLAPMMLQADGIEQVARLDWFDPDSKRVLFLLYFDRPASIEGQTSVRGHRIRYQIRSTAADYVWVGRQSFPDQDVYTATPKPAHLELAARLLAADITAPSAAGTDTAVR